MPLPATAQQLYDVLATDPVISAGLGSYTFPDGSQIPSIGVFHAHETLPPGTTVNGVEIAITGLPGYATRTLVTGGVLTNPTWRIYVSGFNSTSTLQPMAERVLALLPGATAAALPGDPPGEGIGVLDQVVISWTNPTAFVEV